MDNTDDERKLAIERDGFVKTCMIALAANYWALNRQVPQDEIISNAARMALKLWNEFQEFRQGKHG